MFKTAILVTGHWKLLCKMHQICVWKSSGNKDIHTAKVCYLLQHYKSYVFPFLHRLISTSIY